MKYFTYILQYADERLYIGSTGKLDRRTRAHQKLKGSDAKVVFKQAFETRQEALATEKRWKGWSRAKKDALIAGNISHLKQLATRRAGRPNKT